MTPRFRWTSELLLAAPLERVFPFFADARNLELITPPFLRFTVLTPDPIEMRPGARIDYRLRVHGIPIGWRSEITTWDPPRRFVDEQRRGPYRAWHHTHRFEPRDGGTLVADDVRYDVLGGSLVDRLFVRRDVRRIFEYRADRLRERFGSVGSDAHVAGRGATPATSRPAP